MLAAVGEYYLRYKTLSFFTILLVAGYPVEEEEEDNEIYNIIESKKFKHFEYK